MRRLAALLFAAAIWPASATAAPTVTAEPSRLVLGAPHTPVRISVRDAGPRLRAVVSVGSLQSKGRTDGEQRFVWTPPPQRAPLLALIAFLDEGAIGLDEVTVLVIPCSGRTELAIETEPDARVTVEIAGARFGPRQADAGGQLRIPVEVPPLARTARVTAEVGLQSKIRTLPLTVPDSPWLLFADRTQVLLVTPPGTPAADVVLSARGGRLEQEATERDRWLAHVVPEGRTSSVRVVARQTGDPAPRAVIEIAIDRAEVLAGSPSSAPGSIGLEAGLGGGLHAAGGDNGGGAFALTLGVHPWPRVPVTLEAELGLRFQGTTSAAGPGQPAASSALRVFPLEAAARVEVLPLGPLHFDLRVGGGALAWHQAFGVAEGAAFEENGWSWEVFGAGQLGWRLGRFDPFLEVRGSYAQIDAPRVLAHPGGFVGLVGLRWRVR